MKIYQSPAEDLRERCIFGNKLFLAGGISNCPDWQKQLSNIFESKAKELPELVIYNPRRVGDLCKEGNEAYDQIIWEHRHLKLANHYLFWFPKETVCPITLFELGKYAQQIRMLAYDDNPEKHMFVGIHPEYSRKFDLEIQLPLILPNIKIHYSLEDLVQAVVARFNI